MVFTFARDLLHENFFLNLTFPSVLNAIKNSEIEVKYIIFTSSLLPDIFKKNIYSLVENHPYLIIKELDISDNLNISIQRSIMESFSDEAGDIIYATVRLDDDDVIHPEFIRNLEEYVQPAYVNKGVSFSCGYSGIFNGSKFTSFHEINSINNAQGQVLISKRNNEGEIEGISSIYSTGVSHSRLHWKLPVIVDGSKPLYIRTVHEHGDYYSEDYARKMSASSEVIKEKVVENFKIDSFL